jgi:hypothetical protein
VDGSGVVSRCRTGLKGGVWCHSYTLASESHEAGREGTGDEKVKVMSCHYQPWNIRRR